MNLFCAIDLHSNNSVAVIIDHQDNVVFQQRLPNDIQTIDAALRPFREDLHGVAVESTFNWYWLVDGLQAAGFEMMLVNPQAVQQYKGLKHTDDVSDARWLANLMRLGILPTGYIYPFEERTVRDLLRKRLLLVRERAMHLISAQSQIWRSTSQRVDSTELKRAQPELLKVFDHPNLRRALHCHLVMIRSLNEQIHLLERQISQQMRLNTAFEMLLTVDGVGPTLGLTIALETGDIARFPTVGRYASYCRCVNSQRLSNGKAKGQNNTRNGNKYLGWAFVELAHSIIRHNKTAHRFYQRKRAQRNGALATKALAHKMARACYYVMRDQVPFDETKLFA